MTDRSYRTHPVRIGFRLAPFVLAAGLLLGIALGRQTENPFLLTITISVQLIAIALMTLTTFAGGASKKWFADPKTRQSMPRIYPREFAYRCAFSMMIICPITVFIVVALFLEGHVDISDGSNAIDLSALLGLTHLMTLLSLFLVAFNYLAAWWALDHAYRAHGGRHFMDLGMPHSLAEERQDYADDWSHPIDGVWRR